MHHLPRARHGYHPQIKYIRLITLIENIRLIKSEKLHDLACMKRSISNEIEEYFGLEN
jgi:hypothetical protein